eukprot:1120023-Lingulodinium_polyedra.AAC.1
MRVPVVWHARGARERAICDPARRPPLDSIAVSRGVCTTLHNDAVESAVRYRSGSHIARSCIPRARQNIGVRVERAA